MDQSGYSSFGLNLIVPSESISCRLSADLINLKNAGPREHSKCHYPIFEKMGKVVSFGIPKIS
jgi:hypothetical protein